MKSFALIIISILITPFYSISQDTVKQKHRAPTWVYSDKNTNIYGASLGIGTVRGNARFVNTFGVKLELIGVGLAVGLIPESPVAQDENEFQSISKDTISENIYGLSISPLGSVCDCKVSGIALGGFGQIFYKVNGISITGAMTFSQRVNGLQAALLMNEVYWINGLQISAFNTSQKVNGIQIGFINKTKKLKGIQIGLWNINEHRKFPIINWNFKKQ
jgi:hypothetical protein